MLLEYGADRDILFSKVFASFKWNSLGCFKNWMSIEREYRGKHLNFKWIKWKVI